MVAVMIMNSDKFWYIIQHHDWTPPAKYLFLPESPRSIILYNKPSTRHVMATRPLFTPNVQSPTLNVVELSRPVCV